MSVRAKVTCESLEGNTVKFRTVYESDSSKDTRENSSRLANRITWTSRLFRQRYSA